MRLVVTTPLAIAVDQDDVVHLRAEDETGAFGILDRHADFLTVLTISVVSWRDRAGGEHHAAVRGGALHVKNGDTIAIATPEAVAGDDLHRLETEVVSRFRRQAEEERVAGADSRRLYLAAIRNIYFLLRPELRPSVPGQRGADGEGLTQ